MINEFEDYAEKWLKENDRLPAHKRGYLNSRQMKRRRKKEIPISFLPKNLSAIMFNKLYSSNGGSEI
jgi:hypothetical protein